jgi:hypothetical protein
VHRCAPIALMDAHWAYEQSIRHKILCAGSLRSDDGGAARQYHRQTLEQGDFCRRGLRFAAMNATAPHCSHNQRPNGACLSARDST